jgi:uncharacterized protein (DUF58 family)
LSRLTWIVIILLLFISVAMRQPLLFVMSLVLALLAGASELWARYCLTAVHYRRTFGTKRLFFGEETDVRVQVVNAKPLPLSWLRTDDEWPLALLPESVRPQGTRPLGRQRLVNIFSLRWYERVVRHYRILGAHRGVWQFGPTQLRSGDIFGFDIRRQTVENVDHVLVYPRIVPVAALGLPARHPFGEFKSTLRVIDDPVRIAGAREYSRGDSYRYIHWKATARRRSLQTKVFEPSASRPVSIFLNVSTSERFYYGQDWELQEYAITAAASIARQVWNDGHALGFYANALLVSKETLENGNGASMGRGRVRIPPRSHPDQLMRVLEALARIDSQGRWTLEALLRTEGSRLLFGATIVVISPLVNERIRMALADLQRKGYAVTLIGLGDARLDPPIFGVDAHHIGGREAWRALEDLNLRMGHASNGPSASGTGATAPPATQGARHAA